MHRKRATGRVLSLTVTHVTLKDAYLVAHRTEMRAGDLIAMGYDPEVVSGFKQL